MSRRFTFLYIPDSGKKTRRISISHPLLYSALTLILIGSAAMGWVITDYNRLQFDQQHFNDLLVENSEQRQKLSQLGRDLDGLRREMIILSDANAQIQGTLGSGSEKEINLPVGIGGSIETRPADMTLLQQQINDLRLAIDLRRDSQEEVRNLLNDKHSLALATPSGWPTKGWLTSYFGVRASPYSDQEKMHEGLDIAANTGTLVTATADGVVVKSTTEPGFGKVVMIDHGYGYRTIFGHNSKLLVKAGTRVKRGDKIAEVGNTGRSTGSHLHYEIRLNGVPINPRKLL